MKYEQMEFDMPEIDEGKFEFPLTFENYQLDAASTAIYPGAGYGEEKAIVYCLLGLTNEAGEVAGKFKKILRDDHGFISEDKRKELGAEIGDVLWYVSNLASELGYGLEDIARENLAKLNSRKARGVIGGSGDNR